MGYLGAVVPPKHAGSRFSAGGVYGDGAKGGGRQKWGYIRPLIPSPLPKGARRLFFIVSLSSLQVLTYYIQ